jgi:putative oxidoreductase
MNQTRKLTRWVPALLILLFTYTGSSKFFAMAKFTATMYNQPIPHGLAAALAIIIPAAELVTAGCLLFQRSQRVGLYAAFGLLTVFTIYVGAILLHFFPRTPCSCGGIFHWLNWQQHLWVNLFLVALTAITLFTTAKHIHSSLNPSL